ncbi:MAG: dicarboxylate/amino acid:cation symporter [Prevotellaceae bacterium]|jgi:Na+/H+-dicarboxylate symporter|nr:dicarboxylate/amino acid:cation symporter [Prevotellaceae bacterium]
MRAVFRAGLLLKVAAAIVCGLVLGNFASEWIVRIFVTFNGLFSGFLSFCIPLIVLGLVAPAISDMGKNAGRLLAVTIMLSCGFTFFSGFFSYFSCSAVFPSLIGDGNFSYANVRNPESDALLPYFSLTIEPVFSVMTALLLAFIAGVGNAFGNGTILKSAMDEFKAIVEKTITAIIVPLLPLFIFGIFLEMSYSGAAFKIIAVFGKIISTIFVLHILLLVIMFGIAGGIAGKNPFKLLCTMLPAYATALGTSSSAATIPVTLGQVKKLGVSEDIADFCVPLCATIHLSGSTLKIVATSLAICIMSDLPHDILLYSGFILMLGIMMIAAPGVPGGAIMASVAILQSILHFDDNAVGLMIALYIAIDSFGTACNVTGDGAVAVIVNKFAVKKIKQ